MSRSSHVRVPSFVLLLALLPALAGCVQTSQETPARTNSAWSTTGLAPRPLQTLGDPATSGLAQWSPEFDNVPATFDLNGDGVKEIIAHGNDTFVYVFSATTGRALAKIPTTYPPSWHIERVLNGVAAAVLVPGEAPSIVVTNHAGYVAAWRFEAAGSGPDHFSFTKTWEHRMDACHKGPSMDAAPFVVDLNGDGRMEILVQTEEVGFYALNADGSTLWQKCWAGGNGAGTAADLDGDGTPEVIFASDSGFVSVFAGSTGAPLWTFDAASYGFQPASISVTPTVADLDGVAPLEILFTARVAVDRDPATFSSDHMAIFAIHQDPVTRQGAPFWIRQPAWANPLSDTHLIVRDVDGDGRPDIFGMDWNTIGHLPGNWERLGPAHVFRLNAAGDDVWVREIDAWWSNQDIAVGDSDGNGLQDVLVNGPGQGGDCLWRLSATTGAAEGFLAMAPWKMVRGSVQVALRAGDSTQLLIPVEPMDGTLPRGAILLLSLDTHPAAV